MERILLLIVGLTIHCVGLSQNDTISFEDKLFNVTTLVKTKHVLNKKTVYKQGTAFYFAEFPDSTNTLNKNKIWLISNRHVLLPDEVIPDTLSLSFRRIDKKMNRTIWSENKINKDYISKHIKYFKNPKIDVVALEITNIVNNHFANKSNLTPIFVLTKDNFLDEKSKYQPEVGDDILAIGYPKGFYDEYNTYPIVKSGIISSKYGSYYNGLPYFLIDCKLFPGSSGSLIISRPKEIVIYEGSPMFAQGKYILFMGLYSGEPFRLSQNIEFEDMVITKKDIFNSGVVWYSELIKKLVGVK